MKKREEERETEIERESRELGVSAWSKWKKVQKMCV